MITTPPINLDFNFPQLRRPRRNRVSAAVRDMVQETRLHPSDFVVPLFVIEGEGSTEEIPSMPGIHRFTLDRLIQEIERLASQGIRAIDLFAKTATNKKDHFGSEAYRSEGLIQRAVRLVKSEIPEICVMADVALDPYTVHCHDGILSSDGRILNDATLDALGKMSLSLAEAGVDVIAPSDMMDGRVEHIRQTLDNHRFTDVGILSYSAKYCSSLYGPFRDALGSGMKVGNKKTYQMNPANVREALLEATLDMAEGADYLMVKPALPYLDIISKLKEACDLPIAAYHVSGEYSMVKAAAERGWLNAPAVLYECLLSIKRAGADIIFTYATEDVLPLID